MTNTKEIKSEDVITMCPTRKGDGYKLVFNGDWFYCSKKQLIKLIGCERDAVNFTSGRVLYPESPGRGDQ